MSRRGYLSVTETAAVLREEPQTVRYWIRYAKTLPAMQPPGKDPEKSSRARYRIRENDVISFAEARGATADELAKMREEIDAILTGKVPA
ncbi:MAG: hypothetical protein JWP44_4532 [Mucilaginibacter sp.]|nr:hypothetical protein [Mucilaginibacter sp.]